MLPEMWYAESAAQDPSTGEAQKEHSGFQNDTAARDRDKGKTGNTFLGKNGPFLKEEYKIPMCYHVISVYRSGFVFSVHQYQ